MHRAAAAAPTLQHMNGEVEVAAKRFVLGGLAIRPAPADVRCLQINVNHVFHVSTFEIHEFRGMSSELVAIVGESMARPLQKLRLLQEELLPLGLQYQRLHGQIEPAPLPERGVPFGGLIRED